MVYIYVLYSDSAKKHYVGMTENLKKRLREHNAGKSTFTSSFIPWKIIYFEMANDYKNARIREKYLKTAAGKKYIQKQIDGGFAGSLPA